MTFTTWTVCAVVLIALLIYGTRSPKMPKPQKRADDPKGT
jgi:hypothetical protein